MIYLDNSATTRPCDSVIARMAETMRDAYYNASAVYAPAIEIWRGIRACRRLIASALGAEEDGIVFTSGGTESDNLAILGTLETMRRPGNCVVSAVEHPAVSETMKRAARMGFEIRVIPVGADGIIDLHVAGELIDADTALVSCIQVSNETGAVQPIARLAKLAKKANPEACVHVDGVQGFLRMPFCFSHVGVDCYAASGHKIHGPKGIGFLAVRSSVRLVPQMTGGGQERGLRSGTYDAPAILGLYEAVKEALSAESAMAELRSMKLRLWGNLRECDGIRVNGPDPVDKDRSAPHILSLSFDGVRGEVMRNALEREGVLVSTGSACSSHKQKVSPVLLAMGMERERADGTIRVSLGRFNTADEMDKAAEAMIRVYRRLRRYQRR